MSKYFGTDGFRGEAGKTLTADHAYHIGRFLGHHFQKESSRRIRIALGKDTRRSSYMLEYALAAGLTASGADAYMLHVTTTPSVSFAVRQEDFDCGVMISASHNPFFDNGIKLINRQGEKMEEALLLAIEGYLDAPHDAPRPPFASGEHIGSVIDYSEGRNRYVAYLISLAKHSYKGLRIGLDCANGSAWMIAKSVFDALGAKTYTLGTSPNGLNINQNVGSTHIEQLAAFVQENHLDAGFAFDGDADRCLAVDEQGNVITGDHILYIFAADWQRRGLLEYNTVVTTVMSNMGLYRALDESGIAHKETAVGDKYVYECMAQNGYCLGGEQSGHIILRRYATTGDGILTAVQLMETMMSRKLPLSRLAGAVRLYPQSLCNVAVTNKDEVLQNAAVLAEVQRAKGLLGDRGRVLLRPSGTEPMVRIMVEAESQALCEHIARGIEDVIRSQGFAPKTGG